MRFGSRDRLARALAERLGGPLGVDRGEGEAGAILVFGAPLRPDGSLSPLLEERVRAGVDLYRRGLAPLLCLSGGRSPLHPWAPQAEADAMAELARTLGVPEAALRLERKARSTEENALLSARLLRPEGVRRVWLVTQRFHLRRAAYHARRAGLEPLAHRIVGGLEDRRPTRALVWALREYGAWLKLLGRGALDRLR